MREVFAIADRFEVNHLLPELVHIYNCLDQYQFMLEHQMETPFNGEEISKNEDYYSLKALINTLNVMANIEQLQFKLESKQEQFAFGEKAPLR